MFKPPVFGLGRDRLGGRQVSGHRAGFTGFHADRWFLPELKATVAALVSLQNRGDASATSD